MVQPYGGATFNWDTTNAVPGSYEFQVWVANDPSAASPDGYGVVNYTLNPQQTSVDGILVSNANVTGTVTIPWNPGPNQSVGAATLYGMGNLAVDSTYVYYAASDGVWRVLKTGGSPTQLTTQAASARGNLQLYNGYAFYFGSNGSTVYAVPTGGGTATTIGLGNVLAFSIDANGIWYVGETGSLGGAALAGTPPVVGTGVAGLSPAGAPPTCSSGPGGPWATIPTPGLLPSYPLSIYSDGTTVYVGYANGYVTETSEANPAMAPPPIVMPPPPPGTVCWAPQVTSFGSPPNNNVLQILPIGGNLYASTSYNGSGNLYEGSTSITGATAAFSMATDGSTLWYGDDLGVYAGTQPGILRSIPVGGGGVTSIANVGAPGSLVVDSTNVYLTATSYQGTSGSFILELPK
jgi:hypothetical protein